ncbi:MAG: DUF4113 domain-containing protein [Bacteroidota bacterium]|nr:DUF4113 domain-containing protein [uncultured Allomuricauda sp.]
MGKKIKKFVFQATGIPVSIGIAPSKALAKVANRVAKKFPERTGGVYWMNDDIKRTKALKWLKIGDVWGIGGRYTKMLQLQNVRTAYDFVQLPDDFVRHSMTVVGLRLKHDLMGKPSIQMEEVQNKKGIACTRSFDKDYSDFEDVKERISTYASVCASKLRKQGSDCNLVHVFVRTNPFRENVPQYGRSTVIRLPYPTNSSLEIVAYAIAGLKAIFKKGFAYKKAGIMVMGLTPSEAKQLNVFKNSDPRHMPLMKAVDRINLLSGYDVVKLGGQDLKRKWKMNRNHLSPRYTTNINEIPKAKCK